MLVRVCLLATAVLVPTAAAAQKPGDIVKWSVRGPAAPVKAGGTVAVELSAKIEEGRILYAMTQPDGGPIPLEVSIPKKQPFAIDAKRIDAPMPASKKTDTGSENYYERAFTLTVPMTAARDARAASYVVPVEVTYQVCSGSICLRPDTETLPVNVNVKR